MLLIQEPAARGEIPTADLPAAVLSAPVNLLRHEMLLSREPATSSTMVALVDEVFLPLVRAT
ncbi:hypothetical protein ACWCOV_06350 [Kribbella sp. NPDC002412]